MRITIIYTTKTCIDKNKMIFPTPIAMQKFYNVVVTQDREDDFNLEWVPHLCSRVLEGRKQVPRSKCITQQFSLSMWW